MTIKDMADAYMRFYEEDNPKIRQAYVSGAKAVIHDLRVALLKYGDCPTLSQNKLSLECLRLIKEYLKEDC